MAEKTNIIQDALSRMLGKSCTREQAQKFISTASMKACEATCWDIISCGRELTLPEWTRAASVLTTPVDPAACNINTELTYQYAEYVLDSTVTAGTFELGGYFTAKSHEKLVKLFHEGKPVMIAIALNDADVTTVGFIGLLTTRPVITLPGRDSTDLSMYTVTVQPSGEPVTVSKPNLTYCE